MICPLYKAASIANPTRSPGNSVNQCDEGECACWDANEKQCSIMTIASLRVSGVVTTHPG